jgi:ubiquitin thioesterase OTU1
MTRTLRVRYSGGSCSLTVSDDVTLDALRAAVHEKTGARVGRLLSGFPPSPLTDVASLQSGDTIAVVEDSGPQDGGTVGAAVSDSRPPDEAAAPDVPPYRRAPPAPPQHVALPRGEVIVRRAVADDNSCMFNAVGYCLQHSRALATQLRQVVVDAVNANQETWSEGVLGRSNADYQRWIALPSSWGGGIELAILSSHAGVEIQAADIQTCRVDRYGEDRGYQERILLVYDGLHYDALALAPSADAPEDFDTTVLPLVDAELDAAMAVLVKAHHDAHSFTDTAKFSLRCLACREGLTGQAEAVAHAQRTGHASFGEYDSKK